MTVRTMIYTTLTAFAVATVATPAMANDDTIPTEEVRIGDLDLSKASGQETMNKRIKLAARKVCQTRIAGTQGRAIETKCIKLALENSKLQMDQAIARADTGNAYKIALKNKTAQ